ncbi:MAG: Bax inhibitor-1/YccA family protein [Lawsonibacter sp.]|jgi:FtsH-binding integral membrane protein|nr:Bax inhibitor-1/YccA family protein [Lawsonibacter sp.]
MSFDPYEFDRGYASSQGDTLGQYTAKTFLWMVLGLLVTFGVAVGGWVTGMAGHIIIMYPIVPLAALIATLVISVVMVRRLEKMAVGTAIALFVTFSALFGFTMSIYFYRYSLEILAFSFLLTAVYFGALAAYGYLTKRDLSGIRPILFSGLIFLIVFGLLSMFIPALDMFDRVVCLIGIAIFLGYTAYDTQKIRAFYSYYSASPEMLAKASIFSALQLYLDFINLFLYLLRFLGNKRR